MIEHEVAMAIHELRNIRDDKRVQKALAWLEEGQRLMTARRQRNSNRMIDNIIAEREEILKQRKVNNE